MSTDIKAPQFPESIADGLIATWYKQPGEAVSRDELIVDIETDKVVLEVVAPADGALKEIIKGEGDTVLSEEVIAIFEAGAVGSSSAPAEEAPAATSSAADTVLSPAARKLAEEQGIAVDTLVGTGKGGLVTKDDVQAAIAAKAKPSTPAAAATPVTTAAAGGAREEKRVPMTRMRARIAERLLEASQETAMLTTFNEVNMKPMMDLRAQYKDLFEKKHNGTRLGFMSIFVKAATEALKRFPAVNASIDGNDIVY
ncbi:MAG: dihydrolipoamide succinyltransferase, partial [Halieaceae bacterium]|nr:dihydrolipoamide succinyltransferase [Halieaceae bacterium]